MSKNEVTTNDIMEALGQFAQGVDAQFRSVNEQFKSINKHLFRIDSRLNNLESDMSDVKTKVNHIYNVLDDHMNRIEALIQEGLRYKSTKKTAWSAGSSS